MALPWPDWTEILTSRLRLRAISLEDAEDVFALRSFEDVYMWSARPKWESVVETAEWIAQKLADDSSFSYAIELRDDGMGTATTKRQREGPNGHREAVQTTGPATTGPRSPTAAGRVIGTIGGAGFHSPEFGYQFHPSVWGNGYATEALRAWTRHVLLQRRRSRRRRRRSSSRRRWTPIQDGGEQEQEREAQPPPPLRLVARVESSNTRSVGVLLKCSFKRVTVQEAFEGGDEAVPPQPRALTVEEEAQLRAAVEEMHIDLRQGENLPIRPPAARKRDPWLEFEIRAEDLLGREESEREADGDQRT